LDEIEYREESEAEKSINAWRQSERKIMIDTVQDLIQTSHKYAKSQYTPSAQRARWTKLAGQLIWYKDQILKNFTLEAMTIELQALKKQMTESEKQRESEKLNLTYPKLIFPKPGNAKDDKESAEENESSEGVNVDKPEGAKEIA
jgi:hypothetical protein